MHFDLTKQAVHQHRNRITERQRYHAELVEQSKTIRQRHPRMGAKVIYDLLQPQHIGRVGFEKLLINNGFRVKKIKNYFKTTDSKGCTYYSNLVAGTILSDSNQVWVSDISYFPSTEGTPYYLITIMDLYSRKIIGYAGSRTLEAEQTSMKALTMALHVRGIKQYKRLIHHSDRGSQYRYKKYIQLLQAHNIKISMCDNVYDNAHMERLNDTIKNYYLRFLNTTGIRQFQASLKQTITRYNEEKPHSKILKMTPSAYEQYIQKIPTSQRLKLHICPQQSTFNSQNLKNSKEKSSKKERLPANNNSNNNKFKKVNTI